MAVTAGSYKKGEKRPKQGKRGPGKVPRSVKAAIEAAFMDAQANPDSASNLANFKEHSPREFIAAVSKLLPAEVKANITGHMVVTPNINCIIDAMAPGKTRVETEPQGVNGRKPD